MAEPVPGGTPGQVLTKRGYNDYEIGWDDPTGGGGGTGTPSNSVTAETGYNAPAAPGSSLAYARGDHTHGTAGRELPAGGTAGQALSKVDGTDFNVAWATGFTQAAADARYARLTGATLTGEIAAPDVNVTGLAGATSGARFVGATASGAPTTGTFLAGDYVVDRSGQMWVCTTGGSPGTWVAPGSGRELAYAEVTADQSVTVIGAGARVDLTGLSITFTPSSRPVYIQLWTRYFFHTTPGGTNGMNIAICDAANAIAADCGACALAASGTPNPIGSPIKRLASLTPGTPVTYKGMVYCVLGATATFKASTSGPAFIRAWEA